MLMLAGGLEIRKGTGIYGGTNRYISCDTMDSRIMPSRCPWTSLRKHRKGGTTSLWSTYLGTPRVLSDEMYLRGRRIWLTYRMKQVEFYLEFQLDVIRLHNFKTPSCASLTEKFGTHSSINSVCRKRFLTSMVHRQEVMQMDPGMCFDDPKLEPTPLMRSQGLCRYIREKVCSEPILQYQYISPNQIVNSSEIEAF